MKDEVDGGSEVGRTVKVAHKGVKRFRLRPVHHSPKERAGKREHYARKKMHRRALQRMETETQR